MTQITVIDDSTRYVEATADPERGTYLIDEHLLPAALGWELTPAGLCRATTCVPVPDVGALRVGNQLDLVAVVTALGRPVVIDVDAALVAVALPAEVRRRALEELRAPAFELPDVGGDLHRLDDWLGRLPVRPPGLAGPARRVASRWVHGDRRGHRPRRR
jgi:hypothetical protein